MGAAEAKQAILENRTALGIEFGSTRIKAVLVDGNNMPMHQADMSGRIAMRMVCGPTALRTSGPASRTAISRW